MYRCARVSAPLFGKRSRVSLGRYCWCARMHVRSSMNPAEQCVCLSLSLGLQRVWSNIHASLSTCLKHSLVQCLLRLASTTRHCVRAVKEMDSKSIGLCPQGFESPRCRMMCFCKTCITMRRHSWSSRVDSRSHACVASSMRSIALCVSPTHTHTYVCRIASRIACHRIHHVLSLHVGMCV